MTVTSESTIFDVFCEVAKELVKNKEQQRSIDEYLAENHNILRGTLNELLVLNDKFDTLTKDEQGAIANAIYEEVKDERINPSLFFDKKEIARIKKFKASVEVKAKLPYTFKNYVLRSSEQDYITTLTYQEIKEIWDNKILTYNFEIQRKPKEKIRKSGELHREPKLLQRSIKEITQLMKDNKFRSNTIVFNLLMDGNDSLEYDDGELTIVSGELNIIDGAHRLFAILNALEENPEHEGSMDVAIKHLSLEEARFYLGQINKMSKFDKTFVKSLMNTEISDKIVVELEKRSSLKNRITTDTTVSKRKPYLTNFAVLSNAIKDVFDPQNNRDRIDFTEVLINFFDYLVDYYQDDFSADLETLQAAREKSLLNYHNTFVGHVVIAKKLYDKYGKNIPSDEIVRVINSIDFSREGEYGQILNSTGKVNSNQLKKQIQKYFAEKMDELLK